MKVLHAKLIEPTEPREKILSPQLKRIQPAEVAKHRLPESNLEKLFKEKCDSYWYIGQEVLALVTNHRSMFKLLFLKLVDEKARHINIKIQKQQIAQMKVLSDMVISRR